MGCGRRLGNCCSYTLKDGKENRKDVRGVNHDDNSGGLWKYIKSCGCSVKSHPFRKGRLIYMVSLVILMFALAFLTYSVLTDAERLLAMTQYQSLATHGLLLAENIMISRRYAGITMSRVAQSMNRNASDWPYVTVTGFEAIAAGLLNGTNSFDIGFIPFVQPSQVPEFEEFAKRSYAEKGFPDNAGYSKDFGFGIWKMEKGVRVHDTTGETNWDSRNSFVAPLLHTDEGAHPILLKNMYADRHLGMGIDKVVSCHERHIHLASDHSSYYEKCGTTTEMFYIVKHGKKQVGFLFFQPILAANNASKLLGVIPTPIIVTELLETAFADEVTGVLCVVDNGMQSVVLSIDGGVPQVTSEIINGAIEPERAILEHELSTHLTPSHLLYEESFDYRITLYPSTQLYDVYTTTFPISAVALVISILLFTIPVFLLYDFSLFRKTQIQERMISTKRRFVQYVSHEVRTPLNSLCMGIILVRKTLEDMRFKAPVPFGGEQKDMNELFTMIDQLETGAQTAVGILDEILNYDKIQQNMLELELLYLEVGDLVDNNVDDFSFVASSKEINFQTSYNFSENLVEIEDICFRVVGDKIRLAQVVRNLLSNAFKFTPRKGNINLSVSVKKNTTIPEGFLEFIEEAHLEAPSLSKGFGELRISVQDSGMGMSESQLSSLFGEHVQFDANKLQHGGGTGLGLFISKAIVEKHCGKLLVESEGIGKGAKFTIVLPVIEFDEKTCTKKTKQKSEKLQNTISFDAQKMNILIVDDEMMNRMILRRLLEREGHKCMEGVDGLNAVEIFLNNQSGAKNEQFDLILMDYQMPNMIGPEAVREIRKVNKDIIIFGLTGNVLEDDKSFYMSCGANEILSKPLKLEELSRLWKKHQHREQSDDVSIHIA